MQACRSAPTPLPHPRSFSGRTKNTHSDSDSLLSSARKAIFLVTNFGMRNRPRVASLLPTTPSSPLRLQFQSLIDGPVVRLICGDGGKKVSDGAIEIYCRSGREIYSSGNGSLKTSIIRRRLRRHQSFILFFHLPQLLKCFCIERNVLSIGYWSGECTYDVAPFIKSQVSTL